MKSSLRHRPVSWVLFALLGIVGLAVFEQSAAEIPSADGYTVERIAEPTSVPVQLQAPPELRRASAEPAPLPALQEASDPVAEPRAQLRVRVIDTDGEGVAARVSLHERRPVSTERPPDVQEALAVDTTGDGGLVALDVDAGPYLLRIDEYGDALVPPATRLNRTVRDEGFFLAELRVDGESVERTFVLSRAAWIAGFVRDDRGRGIAGAQVCGALQDPEAHRNVYAETDVDGYYLLRCSAGRQRVNVFLGREHAWSDATRPIPQTVDVAGGDWRAADFVLIRSGGRITGVVVDQDGQPMPELEVLCYYKPDQSHLPEGERSPFTMRDHARRAWTDAQGRFELAGLPAERYGIQVGPEDYEPVGQGRLGMVVPRRLADLSAADRVELGTILAHRSRPFRVEGRITLAAQAEVANAGELSLVAVLSAGDRRRGVREVRIPTRRRGAELVFAWTCETPEEGVLLEVRGPNGGLAQHAVFPTPDGTEQAHIAFPQGP